MCDDTRDLFIDAIVNAVRDSMQSRVDTLFEYITIERVTGLKRIDFVYCIQDSNSADFAHVRSVEMSR